MGLQTGQSKTGPLTAGQRAGILFAILMLTAYGLTLQNWGVFLSLGGPEGQPVSTSGHRLGQLQIPSDFARRQFERHKREEAGTVKPAPGWF